jgi:hypothetical protein
MFGHGVVFLPLFHLYISSVLSGNAEVPKPYLQSRGSPPQGGSCKAGFALIVSSALGQTLSVHNVAARCVHKSALFASSVSYHYSWVLSGFPQHLWFLARFKDPSFCLYPLGGHRSVAGGSPRAQGTLWSTLRAFAFVSSCASLYPVLAHCLSTVGSNPMVVVTDQGAP